MKVAVVGATGLVGQQMLEVLAEARFPVTELIPVASEKSVGRIVHFQGRDYTVHSMEQAIEAAPQIALFSAGGSISKEYAPLFAGKGTIVIDNSSAWRMEPHIPLVVPEVNPRALVPDARIIANPNCSTIQMVVALKPLHEAFGLKRLVISTYQSVTGTGKNAVDQLMAEREGHEVQAVYPHPIDLNCLPHCDVFLDNGYTKEEMKLVHETRKIMDIPHLRVTATAVRVPVVGGHSESVNVELERPFQLDAVRELLRNAPGVVLQDDPAQKQYPMPLLARGRNEVFVGRLRVDEGNPNTLNMWIVADNLRKGAATNAVQIAQLVASRLPVV
ncbi:MAG: aspartate-semialdehyde dehydrogenase [Bacteroidetes bacterium]|nr:aspartate-semialdehyde dehydrogenase [Bacteroidota bacterium]